MKITGHGYLNWSDLCRAFLYGYLQSEVVQQVYRRTHHGGIDSVMMILERQVGGLRNSDETLVLVICDDRYRHQAVYPKLPITDRQRQAWLGERLLSAAREQFEGDQVAWIAWLAEICMSDRLNLGASLVPPFNTPLAQAA